LRWCRMKLRTPLAQYGGWLHLLERDLVSRSDIRGALSANLCKHPASRSDWSAIFLTFLAISAGKLEVIRNPVDLVRITQAAVDGCNLRAEQRGVVLELHKPERGLFVLGDEQR